LEGDRETDRLTEIGIVGAGIAGTTLAIALKQSGLDTRLYDRPSLPPASGGPVFLSANGTRVLHAIGLKEALANVAVFPQFATIRHARTGFLLSQRPLGAFSEARYGAPDCLVDGNVLTGMLRLKAQELNIPLDTAGIIEHVDAGSATLHVEGGRQHRHLALAVASGRPPRSGEIGLCNLLNERAWSAPGDHMIIRATGMRAEPTREHDRFLNTWIAEGLVAVEQPITSDQEDQRLALTLITEPRPDAEDPAALLSALLGRMHPHLRNLIADPQITFASEPIADVAEFWFAEKLVLLGGLCHAHSTFPELTPSAALEDAWVLSRMMERWEETPHEGYADYERYRKPRARRLRAYSDAERHSLCIREPMATWRRNLKWSLTSRFLPEIVMQRTDWLYGYDCIKGFI
jgi:salicylate hydroxylase